MASISRSDFLAICTSPKLGEERVEPPSTLPKGYSYLHELLGFPRLEKAARFFALTIDLLQNIKQPFTIKYAN